MSRKIAVIGAGKIGEWLISGLISSEWRTPAEIVATARREERLAELAERYGIETTNDNADAVKDAAVVVIAVKPQDFQELFRDLEGAITAEHTVVTVAAAIPTAFVEGGLDGEVPVVRAMPNAPSSVHEGMAGIAGGTYATEEHMAQAEEVLAHLGRTVRVAESYMDAVTAVSGSGPAYFALLAESMIEAGILLGLSREISTDLVVQTMLGTAKLLRDEKMHPVELREMVTSPGGTALAGLTVLEQQQFGETVIAAVEAANRRAHELAAS